MDLKKLLQSKQVVTLLKQLWAALGKKFGIKMPELPITEEKPTQTKKASPTKRKPKKAVED